MLPLTDRAPACGERAQRRMAVATRRRRIRGHSVSAGISDSVRGLAAGRLANRLRASAAAGQPKRPET